MAQSEGVGGSEIAQQTALSGLPEEELEAIRSVASEREFAPGEALTSEGDFGHSMFVIESGAADVLVHDTKVREAGPGDIVGEVAVLASGRRSATVVATSPVKALALFKRDVWALEKTAPEAASRLRAVLKEHVED